MATLAAPGALRAQPEPAGPPRARRPAVLSASARDLLDGLAGLVVVPLKGHVRLRHDADELAVLLDDRKAANLVLPHQPQRLVERLLRVDGDEVGRGDVPDRRPLRVLALRD